jgi:hypothetical protein
MPRAIIGSMYSLCASGSNEPSGIVESKDNFSLLRRERKGDAATAAGDDSEEPPPPDDSSCIKLGPLLLGADDAAAKRRGKDRRGHRADTQCAVCVPTGACERSTRHVLLGFNRPNA